MGFNSLNIGFGAAGSGGSSVIPGGVNTDVQFNDNGSFGGTNDFTFNKSTKVVGLTGGLSVTQGTLTASFPYLTHTATWNNAGVDFQGLYSNITVSSAGGGSTLIDLQVNGTSFFTVNKNTIVNFGTGFTYSEIQNTLSLTTTANNTAVTLQGYNVTGAVSNAALISMNGTWNTSGSPSAIHLAMTDTTSGADTSFLQFFISSNNVYNIAKNGSLSINTNSTPTASIDVKGQGSTSSTYGLKINNSTGSSNTFVVRDDARVGIGTASPLSLLHVNGVSYFLDNLFVNATGPSFSNYGIAITYGQDYDGNLSGKILSGTGGSMNFEVYDNSKGFLWTTGISTSGTLRMRLTNVGDLSLGISVPLARLHVAGITSDSSTDAFKVVNSTNVLLFNIKNNGVLSAPLTQLGSVGLVAGDLYKDSAANILANGDYVIGMKA